MPQQQLAAACLELRQVGIDGLDEARVLEGERKILVEIERHRVPVGVLPAEISRHVSPERIHRSVGGWYPRPARFDTRRASRVHQLCRFASSPVVRCVQMRPAGLSGSQRVARLAQQRRRIERALARLADDVVLDAVVGIARRHDRVGEQGHFFAGTIRAGSFSISTCSATWETFS